MLLLAFMVENRYVEGEVMTCLAVLETRLFFEYGDFSYERMDKGSNNRYGRGSSINSANVSAYQDGQSNQTDPAVCILLDCWLFGK